MPSCTRSTSGRSPTATVTERVTSPACAIACPIWSGSASMRSGSTRGIGRRCSMAATTLPTIARSTSGSARRSEAEAFIAEARGARHPCAGRPRPEPHLVGSPVVPRRRSPPRRGPPSGRATTSSTGGATSGELPPNDWQSVFGGPAWTRTPDGQWYLHLFDESQPDVNWEHPEVVAEFEAVMRFWLDRGAAGFRIDVAHGLVKAPGYPDAGGVANDGRGQPEALPYYDRDEIHPIVRRWRRVLDEYDDDRMMVAEAWVDAARRPLYLRPDEYHQAFDFDLLTANWDAGEFASIIAASVASAHAVGSDPTWVLSNHDVVRHATRYGLPTDVEPGLWLLDGDRGLLDEERGARRARAAAMVTLALPGFDVRVPGRRTRTPGSLGPAARRPAGPDLARLGSPGERPRRLPCTDPVGTHRRVVRFRRGRFLVAAASGVSRAWPLRHRRTSPARRSSSTAPRSRCGESGSSRRSASNWSTAGRTCWRSVVVTRSPAWPTWATITWRCPTERCCCRRVRSSTISCRPTRRSGSCHENRGVMEMVTSWRS